ncbi:MAG: FMN-binding glutamate synthase family protein, partial [Desulfobacca sp.]|nr:FMN-binding glutamate synthase family protein [Desulfobacca sp.]
MSDVSPFNPPEVKPAPTRFRHALSKFRIVIGKDCDNCGLCLSLCPYGVYQPGSKRPKAGKDYLCLGPTCKKNDFCCLTRCPKEAIHLNLNPSFEVMGDSRWTADLLASTWYMAETSEVPFQGLNYKTGDSGGGFDKIRILFPPDKTQDSRTEEPSLSLELNRS